MNMNNVSSDNSKKILFITISIDFTAIKTRLKSNM